MFCGKETCVVRSFIICAVYKLLFAWTIQKGGGGGDGGKEDA